MCLMTESKMGRHKQWRRIAKRERRRRIRTQAAVNRDRLLKSSHNNEDYEKWQKEQEIMEAIEYEQIEKTNAEENEKWMKAEKIAIDQWKKLQQMKEMILQKSLELEARMKLEFELEQKKKKEQEEMLKQIEEENKRKQEIFMKHLQEFLLGDSNEPPTELLVSYESRPDTEMCPFFLKTACCRFGDHCSRNHRYPGISCVLLAKNFYDHFGLSNSNFNEYDTDLMLEYEDSETYKEFKDFFFDVLPEFEKFGRVIQFKVCNNHERHLRGNTYIEFDELRCAVAAYRSLHTRWYGGRQLSLQFCNVISWKKAICGLHVKKRCPKGRACNFLHVFRNPDNLFNCNFDSRRESQTTPRSWRWSESPENDSPRLSRHISKRSKEEKRNYKDSWSSRRRSNRSPSRIRSSERRRSPGRERSPERRHSPSRERSPENCRSPSRERSPERRRSPRRERSPERRRSPGRERSPERRRSPGREKSPKRCRSPSRERSPERRRSPRRERSPERRRSPGREKSPKRRRSPGRERSRSPRKERSPETRRSPGRERSLERRRSPGRERSPKRRRSPGRERSPERRRSSGRERSPERYRSPGRERSPERRRSPGRERSPERRRSPFRKDIENILPTF